MPKPFSILFRVWAHGLPSRPTQEQAKHLGEVHHFRYRDPQDPGGPCWMLRLLLMAYRNLQGKKVHLLGKENQAKQT